MSNFHTYTIYWSHPSAGEGTFTIGAPTPENAVSGAAHEIAWDIYDTESEDLERDFFIDDLTVEAYLGTCLIKPTSKPLATLT